MHDMQTAGVEGNMKTHIIPVIFLVFCLSGCSLGAIVNAPADSYSQTAFPTSQTEQSSATAPAAPAEVSTAPPETQPPATEPPQTETTPPQMLVQPEPEDADFVKVKRYIPDIVVDLRYATQNNFTKQQIYQFSDVWLRYGTVKKLILVQEEIRQSGLYLKIWDGFRPPSAQFQLWDVCPDPTYVANPNNGFSSHSRGNTVDLTLVYADGAAVVMPTDFDDFSSLADRNYSDCSTEAEENALLLEEVMIKYGFKPYSGEWWHFTDSQSYPVDKDFEPTEASLYYAHCSEYISLRAQPDTTSEVITKILAGEQFRVVATHGDFALVEYRHLSGYVLRSYIQPVK